MKSPRRQAGFSLIEMIGVLAIIAVLAVIIVPKVFSTIASARITSAASSVGAIKSAVAEYAGKYGTIPLTTTSAVARLDDLLFTEQLLETRFSVKIGTTPANYAVATYTRATDLWAGGNAATATQSRIICQASTVTAPATAAGTNFQLTGTTNIPAGSRVVSAVIYNVTGIEARELSLRIDGEIGSQTTATTADPAGKVVYAAPSAAGLTTVYIYIAHQ